MKKSTIPGGLQKPKVCPFHEDDSEVIDYKDVRLMRRYTSAYMKIVPPRRTGLCSKHQRQMAKAIKRARIIALMPNIYA